MPKHPPASRTITKPGTDLPKLRADPSPEPGTKAEAEKRAHDESQAEIDQNLEALKTADKFGEMMDHAPFVMNQSPTAIWGVKASGEKQYNFTRWYFMAKDNVVLDLFLTHEAYDAAEVEKRRDLARRFGTRYAALGPMHSRLPHKDAELRKQFPSLVEQIAQGV
jgi:hypothetical protein